jgi:hypothetical protein
MKNIIIILFLFLANKLSYPELLLRRVRQADYYSLPEFENIELRNKFLDPAVELMLSPRALAETVLEEPKFLAPAERPC